MDAAEKRALREKLTEKGIGFDKAAEEFKAVVALDANDADAHINLGFVYYQKGQLTEAVSEFQAALDISPEDADARQCSD